MAEVDASTAGSCIVEMYGRSSQQFVESMNRANKPARLLSMNPLTATLELLKLEKARFQNHCSAAEMHTAPITPQGEVLLQERQGEASRYGVKNVKVPEQGKAFAEGIVYQKGHMMPRERQVKLGRGLTPDACECGQPAFQAFPCRHMVALALHVRVDLIELLPDWCSAARWKLQYPAGITFVVPGREEVLQVRDESLRLPQHKPGVKGRPKKLGRVKGPLEGGRKRALPTCSFCRVKGHDKRHCEKRLSSQEHTSS
ncbi:unnamed protein product [Chrysoparadoxa australica]